MQRDIQDAPKVRRMLLGGKIIFNDHSSIFDCTVRSMSDEGAEIRMSSTLGVPAAFKLVIKPHDDTYACQVVSRTETDIRVAFKGQAKQPEASAPKNGLHLVR
jgi:hypothetical protein